MIIGTVIPSHGLSDKLLRSITALYDSVTKHDILLCVIDNVTPDESVYNVCRTHPAWSEGSITYVRLPWNAAFARASNTGIHVLRQVDAFLFLNNDCYVEPGCVDKMVSALMSGKGHIIGAKLLYPDGTVQHAGGMIKGKWEAVLHEFRGYAADAPEVIKSRNVPFVTGACMMVKASPFVRLGGFMECFNNGYEDVDLCFRFIENFMGVYYCADAVAIHE